MSLWRAIPLHTEKPENLRSLGLVALAYALTIVLIFSPFFFFGKTLFSVDLYAMLYKPFSVTHPDFLPFNHFEEDILKFYYLYAANTHEHLYRPYWVSEIFGGIPLYAITYASHFSPLNWIIPLGPLLITYPLRVIASLWIAGISMFSFTRDIGLSRRSAFLSGLCYMFSSLFITLMMRWWLHAAYAWVPFLLLFSHRAMLKGGYRNFFFASLFLALAFLDGFFQTSMAIIFVLGTFLATLGWRTEGSKGVARAMCIGIAVGSLALLLSAVMWAPQLEYFLWDMAKGSSRVAGLYYGKNISQRLFSVPLLIAAFFPQGIGSVRTLDLAKLARSHIQDFSLFLGVIPLLLGLASWRLRTVKPVYSALWALAAVGIMIPVCTPLDRYFYFRFFAVYLVGMAALAGIGLESAWDDVNERLRLAGLAKGALALTGAIFGAALGVRVFRWIKPGWLEARARAYVLEHVSESTIGSKNPGWMADRAERFVSAWSLGTWEFNLGLLLTAVAAWLVYAWAKGRVVSGRFYPAALLITFLQLGLFVHSWQPFLSLEKYPIFPPNSVADFINANDPTHQFRTFIDDSHGMAQGRYVIPGNTNFFYGFPVYGGFDGLRPSVVTDTAFDITDYARLGEMNVKFVVANSMPPLRSPDLRLVQERDEVSIYENRRAQPRGRIFYDFEVKPAAEIKAEVLTRGGPSGEVWLEKNISLIPVKDPPSAEVKLLHNDALGVSYEVTSAKPGLFVASETYYPGWKAEWNGRAVEILRANYVMRAVEIPAGTGKLVFRFEPTIYWWGFAISLISLVLALGYLWLDSRRALA